MTPNELKLLESASMRIALLTAELKTVHAITEKLLNDHMKRPTLARSGESGVGTEGQVVICASCHDTVVWRDGAWEHTLT